MSDELITGLSDLDWQHLSDAELVQRARAADAAADRQAGLAAIFARHHRAVLAFCGGRLQDPHAAADAAAEAFAQAFAELASLREPERLRGWLIGIAHNQCREQWRIRDRTAPLPEHEDAEQEADAYDKASKRRRAQVDRMLDTVVATLTDKQQQIFRLAIRDGLTGARLAARLGTTSAQASRLASEVITMTYKGFGALVLAREGRRFCADLARILDQATSQADDFDRLLRQRIIRHLDICKTCDNCTVCNVQRERLVRPYAPALIPVLTAPVVKDRVSDKIRILAAVPLVPPVGTDRDGDDDPLPVSLLGAESPVEAAPAPGGRAEKPAEDEAAATDDGATDDGATDDGDDDDGNGGAIVAGGAGGSVSGGDRSGPGRGRGRRSRRRRRMTALLLLILLLLAGGTAGWRLLHDDTPAPVPAAAPAEAPSAPLSLPPIVTQISGTYTLERRLVSCTYTEGCAKTLMPIRVNCAADQCVILRTDGVWHEAHPLSYDGRDALRAAGRDDGAAFCTENNASGGKSRYDAAGTTIVVELTVDSWTVGPDRVRRPDTLHGTYRMASPPSKHCDKAAKGAYDLSWQTPSIALGRPATASGQADTALAPAAAADGEVGTYWESANHAFPQWLQVDLGAVSSIGRVTLRLPPSSEWASRTQTLSVLTSMDGSAFTTVAESANRTFTPATGNTVSITVPPTNARYVRVDVTANTGWPAAQVAEFEVYPSGPVPESATLRAGPPSPAFAVQALGRTSPAQAVTVVNTGTAAASIAGVSVSGDFLQTSTCTGSLAVGASCVVRVRFRPAASGRRTGSVIITSSAANSPTTIRLSGIGAGAAGTPSFLSPRAARVKITERLTIRVKPVEGSAGYLFGFFQRGKMVWENQRDEGHLSGTEYVIEPGGEAHTHLRKGALEIWARALVDGQWSEARVITITLV